MEHSFFTRLCLAVFTILLFFYAMFFLVNVVCRSSVRTCVTDRDCPEQTVCADQGDGEVRCAPPACKTVETSYESSGIPGTEAKIFGFIAKQSVAFSHWVLKIEKTLKKEVHR